MDKDENCINYFIISRSGAVAHVCDCNVTIVGSITIKLLFINIFISMLWHRGKKPNIDFPHSTRNASKNSAENGGNGMS